MLPTALPKRLPSHYLTFGRAALITLNKLVVLRVTNVSVEDSARITRLTSLRVINPLKHFLLLLSTPFLYNPDAAPNLPVK